MSLIVDEHRQYIADTARITAFRQALLETIRPGDVVLDLGSGTGVLGLLACRAGAARVYSIEHGGMIELAREICKANGFQDRIKFIREHSTRVQLPEKVDVAVCDQIGRFGFEAGVNQFFEDVRKRLVKPAGKLVPARVDLLLAPVECPEIWERVEFWNNSPAGFDFRPARKWAANTGYPVKFRREQLLGDPAILCSQDMMQVTSATMHGEVHLRSNRSGTLHGIGGWFSAQLSKNVELSNSPLATSPIGRHNVCFPIDQPVRLDPGDLVRVQMQIIPSDLVVSWNVEIFEQATAVGVAGGDGLKGQFSHSTFSGMLLSREDLVRTAPKFVPKLNPWGEARKSILELCNGVRSVQDIESEVYRRHEELFSSQGAAAAFVAEVITRYAL